MDFTHWATKKNKLDQVHWPCLQRRERGALLLVSLSMGMWSCGPPSEGMDEVEEAGPRLTGVKFAEFFGFSEGRDTLWLQSADGEWTPWTRGERASGAEAVSSDAALAIELPLAPKVATWSTTHVPHLQALQAKDLWVGTGYRDRINLSKAAPHQWPMDLGGDGGLDEEALVASGAHVLTSYPFGDPMQGVDSRTGVKVMPLREYEEEHPLARAEYIKLFGWLLDRVPAADVAFGQIAQRYATARDRGQQLALDSGRPVVFTGSEQGGLWTAPTFDGLVARLVEDAGGHYLLDHQTEQSMGLRRVGSNIEMELEQFAMMAAGADAWGKVVYAPEGWYRQDAAAAMPWLPLEDKLLFHCNTAEVDYFGQAVLEPDFMLEDLVSILHGQTTEGGAPRYFQRTRNEP